MTDETPPVNAVFARPGVRPLTCHGRAKDGVLSHAYVPAISLREAMPS